MVKSARPRVSMAARQHARKLAVGAALWAVGTDWTALGDPDRAGTWLTLAIRRFRLLQKEQPGPQPSLAVTDPGPFIMRWAQQYASPECQPFPDKPRSGRKRRLKEEGVDDALNETDNLVAEVGAGFGGVG